MKNTTYSPFSAFVRQTVDTIHEDNRRHYELGEVGNALFNLLWSTDEVLEIGHTGRRLHGKQSLQSTWVVAKIVRRDESSARADSIGKKRTFCRMELDMVLCPEL